MTPRDPLREHYYANLYRPLVNSGLVAAEIPIFPGPATVADEYTGVTLIKGLELPSGWRLDLSELVVVDPAGNVEKVDYSYNALDHLGQLALRFDNSPYHKGLPFFPHHRHDGSANRISPNPDHSFRNFLQDLVYLTSSKYVDKGK